MLRRARLPWWARVSSGAWLVCVASLAAPAAPIEPNLARASFDPAAIATADDPAAQLLEGVTQFATVGSPGVVAVFGPDAFPVVVGRVDGEVRAPVVAASKLGSGRIVAFAHTGYFSRETAAKLDGPRFFTNAARWASRRAKGAVRIALVAGDADFAAWLSSLSFEVATVTSVSTLDASSTDLIVLAGGNQDDAGERTALERLLRGGCGLFVAQTPWGWQQLNPTRDLATQHPQNALLVEAGLAWVDGTTDATAPGAFTVGRAPALVHAGRALERLSGPDANALTRDELAQTRWSLLAPLRALPRDDRTLRPGLAKLRAKAATAIPTHEKPLKDDQALARLALALDLEEAFSAPPESVRAHPAAAVFPGAVPANAPRVTRTVVVDTRVPEWHSTGTYAAPGEVIEVELPAETKARGLVLQIGAHTDDLTDAKKWSRAPRVVTRAQLRPGVTRVASPFGGLVYVDVPAKCAPETLAVELSRVVDAPRFVAGATDVAEWKSKLRALPAPWAELETRKMILTVPSRVVRELDDPAALLAFWDSVSDACCDLGGVPRDRARAERYVADEQISAGYMHSGYPIMTHLDVAETFVDLAKLRANTDGCGWGFYHELGHNHQRGTWTFEGTGEVTNNLFTVYVLDTVVKASDERTSPAECKKRFDAYRAAGARYEDWKSDPFLALGFFLEIQRAFGWQPFRTFFAEMEGLPRGEHPRDDLDERTQWLLRLSRAAGRDLSPWFALWNVPVHPDAPKLLADLPAWVADGYAAR